MEIGKAIRKIRDAKKVSRRKLSIDLQIDSETIKRIELGHIKNPRFLTLALILDYFGYQFNIGLISDNFLNNESESEEDESFG